VGGLKSAAHAWLVNSTQTALKTDVELTLRLSFHGSVIINASSLTDDAREVLLVRR
jgi:hypothetical protein